MTGRRDDEGQAVPARPLEDRPPHCLSVRHLWPEEPCDCCICGRPTLDHFAVPYYCGAVRSGKSEGGYAPACQRCYDRWARWDDAMEEYDSWLAVLRPRDLLAGVDDDEPPTCGVKGAGQ